MCEFLWHPIHSGIQDACKVCGALWFLMRPTCYKSSDTLYSHRWSLPALGALQSLRCLLSVTWSGRYLVRTAHLRRPHFFWVCSSFLSSRFTPGFETRSKLHGALQPLRCPSNVASARKTRRVRRPSVPEAFSFLFVLQFQKRPTLP